MDEPEEEHFWDFLQMVKQNVTTLISRFIQLARRPADLAPLVFSMYSLFVSLFSSREKLGVDFLYPMSSLTRRESSGRLARLILDHSRNLKQPNLHEATVIEPGFDPPRVAVIDLSEVPRDVVERGYSAPADLHGFIIMFVVLEILFALYAYILAPIKTVSKNWPGILAIRWFGQGFFVFYANWMIPLQIIAFICYEEILHGDGTLTLALRSGPITPSHVVFLDREFTLIMSGSQNAVEAITESGLSISTPFLFRYIKEMLQSVPFVRYEVLKALCNGFFLTFFVGTCLAFRPSLITASVPLVLAVVISGVWSWAQVQGIRAHHKHWFPVLITVFTCAYAPSWFLFFLAAGEKYLFEGALEAISQVPALIPLIPFTLLMLCDQDFPIHITKLLDIIGNPPIRRWEFDTLATAATFQCLVLCHGIPRPIKIIDVLALLDIFIPDQTVIWMAWKRRVADRIMHEVEISFTPTLPTFGDERQERLKRLLDQAQKGYDAYRDFHDWYFLEPLL